MNEERTLHNILQKLVTRTSLKTGGNKMLP